MSDYLDLHGLAEIFGKIYDVRTKWNNFGLALGMDYNDLAAVKIECRDIPDECLKELLARWLKKSRPRPTWKALIKALKSKTVGFEELAEKMTRCKQNEESAAAPSYSPITVICRNDSPHNMANGLTREDQIQKLASSFKLRNKAIGIFYHQSQSQKRVACKIYHRLSALLYGGECVIQRYEFPPQASNWLQTALLDGIEYFIFVGLPADHTVSSSYHDQCQPVSAVSYFNTERYVQRMAEVVIVRNESHHNHIPNYLGKFLQLDGGNMDKVAEDALCLFAAPRPKPLDEDQIHFNEIPKLFIIKQRPLGLKLKTRMMSPVSEFHQVMIIDSIKGKCHKDVREKLSQSHIQSYNGVFLDGMDINEVNQVIQSLQQSPIAFLMVRYIHPTKYGIPPRPQVKLKPEAPRHDPHKESLPVPVYILGDNYSLCKKVFEVLKQADTAHSEPLQADMISVDSGFMDTEGHESGKFENLDLPADTSKLNDVQCESDNTFVRAKLSTTIVSDTPGPKKPVIVSDTPRKPVLQSTPTPPTEKIDYVLTLPKKFDRNFAHIFFRKSGIYLVAVSIEDMMEDPAIEFENLCYWLRQIQTYVEPESIKRVIVVGIHNTLHTEVVQLHNVSTLLSKLDRAIHEAEFSQIMEVSCRNLTVCVNFAEPDHKNSQLLHTCVNKCMDVMKAKSECYEKSFFSHTYQPFTQLNRTLLKISRIMAIIATTEEIMDCYNFTHPRFKETLANYSQACISAEGEYHLLDPAFLIKLLRSMEMNPYNYSIHATDLTAVRNLPVFSAPFPKQQMDEVLADMLTKKQLRQLAPQELEAILEWAEKLDLMYTLGKLKEHKVYFVPYLATEVLGDEASFDWDHDEASKFLTDDVTILYSEMHIPVSYQFFNRLVAELLKDVIEVRCLKKSGRCLINLGCMEAILPIQFLGIIHRVYLQYHPLQNIIEFRAKIAKQQLFFLKAVENKMKGALSNSRYRDIENVDRAFSFALPATASDSRLRDRPSALLTLVSMPNAEESEKILLKTRLMTPDVQREWASSAPEMKEITPQQYMDWSKELDGKADKLMLLATKLGIIDEEMYRQCPRNGGCGELILALWVNSSGSYKDLVAALKDENIRLDSLANKIESHFSTK